MCKKAFLYLCITVLAMIGHCSLYASNSVNQGGQEVIYTTNESGAFRHYLDNHYSKEQVSRWLGDINQQKDPAFEKAKSQFLSDYVAKKTQHKEFMIETLSGVRAGKFTSSQEIERINNVQRMLIDFEASKELTPQENRHLKANPAIQKLIDQDCFMFFVWGKKGNHGFIKENAVIAKYMGFDFRVMMEFQGQKNVFAVGTNHRIYRLDNIEFFIIDPVSPDNSALFLVNKSKKTAVVLAIDHPDISKVFARLKYIGTLAM